MVWLRICERFGLDPRTRDTIDPAMLMLWEEYDAVREQEEARSA